jgi:2-dehydro-3-deoxyphosphogluconate aldolase / (4S)-4-hydroxy-2-oxoglutarate aldolase
VRFVATGGMSVTNTSEFLEAGASAVALGSALADEGQRAALSGLVGRVRVAE